MWTPVILFMILAIDIGGTKFSMAAFDGDRMVRRESRATDAAGGREWMVGAAQRNRRAWRRSSISRCGIGFGGPVDWPSQRVVLSTHVGGWRDFDLPGLRHRPDRRARGHGQRRQRRRARRGALRGGEGLLAALLHDPFHRHRRRHLSPVAASGAAPIPTAARSATSPSGPDGPECLCGARGCFERMCCGLWLERDYGRPAKELLQDDAFVERYVVDLALGLKAAVMLSEPGAYRHRWRHR